MVVVFFVFIFFLNVFSMFVVPTVPVLRADYFWPGVESGGTFVQMSLVTDHPAGRISCYCSALHALLGLHHHAHFVEHGFVVCPPYSSVCLLNAMSEGPTFDILPLENIQGSFYSKHQFGGDGGWGCLGGIASTESHKVRISSPCMLYTDCTKCT